MSKLVNDLCIDGGISKWQAQVIEERYLTNTLDDPIMELLIRHSENHKNVFSAWYLKATGQSRNANQYVHYYAVNKIKAPL